MGHVEVISYVLVPGQFLGTDFELRHQLGVRAHPAP